MYLCNYISGLVLHHTLQKGKGLIPEATVVVVQGNTLVPYVCTCIVLYFYIVHVFLIFKVKHKCTCRSFLKWTFLEHTCTCTCMLV